MEILESEQPGIEGGQEGALAQRDLLRGFAELPEEQRAVLLLVAVEDFSYREAAGWGTDRHGDVTPVTRQGTPTLIYERGSHPRATAGHGGHLTTTQPFDRSWSRIKISA